MIFTLLGNCRISLVPALISCSILEHMASALFLTDSRLLSEIGNHRFFILELMVPRGSLSKWITFSRGLSRSRSPCCQEKVLVRSLLDAWPLCILVSTLECNRYILYVAACSPRKRPSLILHTWLMRGLLKHLMSGCLYLKWASEAKTVSGFVKQNMAAWFYIHTV